MRGIHVYLTGYFLLILGAGLTLREAGVLDRLPREWLALAALVAVGLGVLLAVTSTRSVTRE